MVQRRPYSSRAGLLAAAATPGGAQIAADEINAKGGVLGRRIEIVTYDNKSSSAGIRCARSSAPSLKTRSPR